MDKARLTYGSLQSLATRRVFFHALKQGQLGPLVFLWSLGTAVLVGLDPWPFVPLWTLLIMGAIYGLLRSYLGNLAVREQLYRSALEGQFWGRESWKADLRESAPIKRGSEILIESALIVEEMEQSHGHDSDLRSAFDDACGLLSLQFSLVRSAENLKLSVGRIYSSYDANPAWRPSDLEATTAMGSARSDRNSFEELTAEAAYRVQEVSKQLEAFLLALQELKEHASHFYHAGAAHLSQEMANVLVRIQARLS